VEPLPEPLPDEPTVLDWFRSVLRLKPISIPSPDQPRILLAAQPALPSKPAEKVSRTIRVRHLRLPASLVLALLGQAALEAAPVRDRLPIHGIVLYLLALALAGWGLWKNDLALLSSPEAETVSRDAPARAGWLGVGAILGLLAFLSSGGNTFRLSTVVLWTGGVASLLIAFWEGDNPFLLAARKAWAWLHRPRVFLGLDGWAVGFWMALGLAGIFRFVHLSTLPLDMWSDQAEKLLDVADVLAGRYSIFFTRNTGREALQFYIAAATARIFGTGVSFLTLKIGTALAGWLTLPFIYALAREVVDRRVALAGMILAGVAMWPNVLSRTGLRFSLYPLVAAPALFLLARGLRRQNRNDLLLAGVIAGIGLHGYSPARVLPVVLAVGLLLYALHPAARGQRARLLSWGAAAAGLALVVFLPLLRVALQRPDDFLFRSLSRLGTAERPLPGPVGSLLVSNLRNALAMFNWDSGLIWVVSLPGKPLLDWVTGALFVMGTLLCLIRYARRRQWLDLFLLLSIPMLMLPSWLALAFPGENPAPNRASGVLIPIFILAGWALVAVAETIAAAWPGRLGRIVAAGWTGSLLVMAVLNNYALTFQVFYPDYLRSAWNTSDGGQVIRGFAESVGDYEMAHVVPYPYWWDTRLVGIQAGRPLKDYALARENLDSVASVTDTQLFLFHTEDVETLDRLRALFPQGQLRRFDSDVEGHDFMIYLVPERPGSR
jgi:hypothetical protein